jgi:nucleotide-binding universal stress UspA family protein
MDIRTILLPTDFSECASYAVPFAASFARSSQARLICLHVIEPVLPAVGATSFAPMTEAVPLPDLSETIAETAARELPQLANHEALAGLETEEIVVHGDPAAEIVRVARTRGVDLIVISSHGRTGWGRWLFGSTAEAVARYATCPVLVVKPPAAEVGG